MIHYQQIYERRWEQLELRRVAEIWQVLVQDYFQKLIRPDSRVLDIGCGF
jgi:2-polyprenyl-3-methyl-5-hydroxy-6-metoxy-1,4-benzoquinol methylase